LREQGKSSPTPISDTIIPTKAIVIGIMMLMFSLGGEFFVAVAFVPMAV
jgi:hypothetical protein